MLIEIVQDLLAFLIILIYSIFTFAILLTIYTKDSLNYDFSESMRISYRVVHGDWDIDGFGTAEWVWFILATIVNPLIMLNLVIALMGDTYNNV
mmetsp:Transcript_13159/g.2022  ORF Transcript_13159/g.2022 Transcript_13159/m.2022 type:complete len:94 (+) Transcript_13159:750-1031(+)